MKRTLISVLVIALMIPSLTQFSGCGGTHPDFKQIIDSAIHATAEIKTYRMEVENNYTENGETEQSKNWIEFVAPDRMHVTSRQFTDNGDRDEYFIIGSTQYTREINSNDWQTRDLGNEIGAIHDLASGVLQSAAELEDIEELRDEKIDGAVCFHYIGSMNMAGRQEEQLASLDQSSPYYEQQKLMYESIEYVRDNIELWIGKDDYLLRKYIMYMETSVFRDKGEDTEEVENNSVTTICKFLDFNKALEIEPPLTEPFEGVHLIATMRQVDSDSSDPAHQLMTYAITISNEGTETAYSLRLFVDTKITNDGEQTYEAEADAMPVNLTPERTEIYHVSWEYDLIELTKEKFLEYIRQNTLRATWTDIEEVQHDEELLTGG